VVKSPDVEVASITLPKALHIERTVDAILTSAKDRQWAAVKSGDI